MSAPAQSHRCPCGCQEQIAARTLVCPPGWRRIPEALRQAVVATQATRRLAPTDPEAIAEHRSAIAAAKGWLIVHPPPRPVLVTATLPDLPPAAAGWETSKCEACHAPVIWATTDHGDRVCVDVTPVATATGAADARLSDRGPGRPPRVVLVRDQSKFFGIRSAYRRHLTTCPHGDHYRARARRRAS